MLRNVTCCCPNRPGLSDGRWIFQLAPRRQAQAQNTIAHLKLNWATSDVHLWIAHGRARGGVERRPELDNLRVLLPPLLDPSFRLFDCDVLAIRDVRRPDVGQQPAATHLVTKAKLEDLAERPLR